MEFHRGGLETHKRMPVPQIVVPGTFYRFIGIIQQLDLNYDLYSMSGNEILDLLPPEFNKWKGQKRLL